MLGPKTRRVFESTFAPLLTRARRLLRLAVTIAAGGVLPNIHSVLLPAAGAPEGKVGKK